MRGHGGSRGNISSMENGIFYLFEIFLLVLDEF